MFTVRPPSPSRGRSPTLAILHRVERVLREAHKKDEGPLTLAEVRRRLGVTGVGIATVRTCVDELARLHLVTEDPRRGILWTAHGDPAFWSRSGTRRLA